MDQKGRQVIEEERRGLSPVVELKRLVVLGDDDDDDDDNGGDDRIECRGGGVRRWRVMGEGMCDVVSMTWCNNNCKCDGLRVTWCDAVNA